MLVHLLLVWVVLQYSPLIISSATACTGQLATDGLNGVNCTTDRGYSVVQLWSRAGLSASTVLSADSFEDTIISCGIWSSTMMGPMNFSQMHACSSSTRCPHSCVHCAAHTAAASQAVVAGEGAAREGRSVWWQRIHLGAALNMTALTGAALIVRGGNRGAGGHFDIVDAPSQWDMDCMQLQQRVLLITIASGTQSSMQSWHAYRTAERSLFSCLAGRHRCALDFNTLEFVPRPDYVLARDRTSPDHVHTTRFMSAAAVAADAVTCSSAPAAWQDTYPHLTRYSGAHAYAWHVIDVAAALRAQYPLTGQLNLALEPAGSGDGPLVWSTRSSAHPPLLVLDWA
ncbi:hypothetical protein JKP88DRAFT_242883 [Tribonema minus]|uniref:Uncharacterized protein n=1 Tax=Tribonema minus TaxID=303371 RepID=A0A835ZC35_9STRA|nr:hypothetical protein JKP88DRAFT_242883 [Tribonema minus]